MRLLILSTLLCFASLPTAHAQDAAATAVADAPQAAVYAPYEAAAIKRWEADIAALEM